jgi:hypothetical protein
MNLDNAIFAAGVLTEAILIGLLFYRHVWRTLPMFCCYCVWGLLVDVTGFLIMQFQPSIYFHVYFAIIAIDSIFMFGVLVELIWSVLRPVRVSLPRSALILIGVLILVAGAAIWPFAATGLQHVNKEGLLYTRLQQTVSILRILFFLLLAGGSQLFSIGWRDRELQVATGLGIYSIVSLAVSALQAHQTSAARYQSFSRLATAGYLGCMVYWVVSFIQHEAARREFTPQMQRFLLAVAGAARSARVSLEDSRGSKSHKPDDR